MTERTRTWLPINRPASTLIARCVGRTREFAIRQALGASRGRLMRQMLIESLLISLAGGVAAIVVLRVVGTSLLALMPAGVPRLCEIHADWRTLFLALLLSFITGALFVLTPALYASALDPNRDLKGWSNQRRTERAAEPLARCSCDAGGGVIGSVADWRRIADSELLRHAASAAGARAERPYHRANLDSHFQ